MKRTRIRPMSAKRRAVLPTRREVRAVVFDRDRGCVIAHLHDCTGPLTPHHLLKEGQGGPYLPHNLVALCAGGNVWVEDNPEKARWWGLAVAKGVTATEAAERRRAFGIAPNWQALVDGSAA